jgi:hypothetical protein
LRYGEEESRSQEEEKDDQEEVMRAVRIRARGSKTNARCLVISSTSQNQFTSAASAPKTEATDKQKESFPATAEAFLFWAGRYFLERDEWFNIGYRSCNVPGVSDNH